MFFVQRQIGEGADIPRLFSVLEMSPARLRRRTAPSLIDIIWRRLRVYYIQ